MAKFEMRFLGCKNFELYETFFRHRLEDTARRSVRGKTCGAYHGCCTFQWTKGIQGIALLFIRAKMKSLGPNPSITTDEPDLIGGQHSLAASLDYALDKKTSWLLEMFGWDGNGSAFAQRLFHRTNPGRKRSGPVALSVNIRTLPPQCITIHLNNIELITLDELSTLSSRLAVSGNTSQRHDIHYSRANTILGC